MAPNLCQLFGVRKHFLLDGSAGMCQMFGMMDFTCRNCQTDFAVTWDFGDVVTCPTCGTAWETDYETNADGDVFGPWLADDITGEET